MVDAISNAPQVSMVPEPVSQIQKVDLAQFKNLDDLIFNILDGVGNKVSALAVSLAGKAMDTAANVSDRVMSAAQSPMDSNFIKASASPEVAQGAEIDAPGRGKGITMDSAPSMGSETVTQSKSPSNLVANVDMRDVGNFTPTAVGGKMREESQGMAV